LTIEKTTKPKPRPAADHAFEFGKIMTDHMLEIDWTSENGWGKPRITPYHNFEMDPANSTLHYALECFEGMKAYPNLETNKINLFRPLENVKRMQTSFKALAFPEFDKNEFLKCISKLVDVDRDWMPFRDKHSLYIRPTGISWENTLGVRPASAVKLYTILSPVGPYYPKGFKPVSVDCYTDYVRAWYKGSGDKKLGSNYGPTIRPAQVVSASGYDQILWLLDDYISEVGVMNVFIFWINEQGEKELITCPLDGTILPGITRKSVLELTRHWDEFKVTEDRVKIQDLVKAIKEERVLEMFGCGTATVVAPINNIGYNGQDYPIQVDEELNSGKLSYRIFNELNDLQSGKKEFRDWTVEV
jgi:branched-chain amino acid aminotransferase